MDNQENHLKEGPFSLLHLSDLHFGPYRRESSEYIMEKIAEDIFSMNVPVGAVVITGDLVEAALPSQYSLALESLLQLHSKIGVPREHWIFVPGNHDVNLDMLKASKSTTQSEHSENSELVNEKFDNYRNFLSDFYGKKYSRNQITQFVNGGAAVTVNKSIPIIIGILNSCKHVTSEDSSGYVEDKQSDLLAYNFSKSSSTTSDLRIVAVHHSFLPTPGPVEHITNYEELRRKLEMLNVKIILHGHRHVSCPDVVRRPWEDAELIILPTGSASLGVSVLGEIRNRYQIVSIHARKKATLLKVFMRAFESKRSAPSLQGVWCPDVAYAEQGILQIPLKTRYARPTLPSPILTWDNQKLLFSILRTIPSVSNYVRVSASESSGISGSMSPSLLYPEKIGNVKRILLVGTCGVGKSTTLRWLAYECVKKKHRTQLQRVPIFFDLKQYSGNTSLWNNILVSLKDKVTHESKDSLESARKRGGLLLFFDSLDEVADRKVLEEIEGLVTLGNLVVVACRSSFYFLENMTPLFANYCKIELSEWNYEQVASLMQNRLSGKMTDNAIKLFRQNIPKWIRTPLLTELFCQFLCYQSRDISQLRQKSVLYKRIVDRAIAYSRDSTAIQEKYINIRTRTLIEIAWQMFIEGEGWLKSEKVEDIVSKLMDIPTPSKQEKLTRELVDSPILIWTNNMVTFNHIAFQEYLVAKKIIELVHHGISSSLPQIPRDEAIALIGEMMSDEDLPNLVEWAISTQQYWIFGLLSRSGPRLLEIFEKKLEQLCDRFETEQSEVIRLIWCIGELRLRSRKIRLLLEKVFEKCDNTNADIAWFAAFAIEKIWAIEQLPHYALRKLVTKYSSATTFSLSSKLSCILSVADRYGKKRKIATISEDEIIRLIQETESSDPRLYNALWIAGSRKLQSAVNAIIDLISTAHIQRDLFIYNCAIEALGKIGNRLSLEILLTMLRHPSLRLRWRALEALSLSPWGRRQLKHPEFASFIEQIFSQIDSVGSPFEKERVKKTKQLLRIRDKKEAGTTL